MKRPLLFIGNLILILLIFPILLTAQLPPDAIWMNSKNPVPGDTSKPVPHLYKRANYHTFTKEGILYDSLITQVDNATSGMSIFNDSAGDILLYSNGYKVGNRYGDLIKGGGDNLFQIPNNAELAEWGDLHFGPSWTPQNNIMLHDQNDSLIFHLIHIKNEYILGRFDRAILAHTIINMRDEDRTGEVIQRAISIIQESVNPGMLTACQHANGRDWWISSMSYVNNDFLFFLFTNGEIQFSHRIPSDPLTLEFGSKCVYSPDHTKMVVITQSVPRGTPPKYPEIVMYHFDNATGMLEMHDHVEFYNQYRMLSSIEFSMNSKKLYFRTNYHLFSFDFDNYAESFEIIDMIEFYEPFGFGTLTYGDIKLSPDCRLLITRFGGEREICSIDFPDEDGTNSVPNQRVMYNKALYCSHFPNTPHLRSSEELVDWCQEWGWDRQGQRAIGGDRPKVRPVYPKEDIIIPYDPEAQFRQFNEQEEDMMYFPYSSFNRVKK